MTIFQRLGAGNLSGREIAFKVQANGLRSNCVNEGLWVEDSRNQLFGNHSSEFQTLASKIVQHTDEWILGENKFPYSTWMKQISLQTEGIRRKYSFSELSICYRNAKPLEWFFSRNSFQTSGLVPRFARTNIHRSCTHANSEQEMQPIATSKARGYIINDNEPTHSSVFSILQSANVSEEFFAVFPQNFFAKSYK